MSRPQAKGRGYTYRDYLAWPEDQRWEIIDGAAYAMTPAPTPTHQALVGELLTQFHSFLRGKPCRVFSAPIDLVLPVGQESDEEVGTVVQPDLLLVCDQSKVGDQRVRGAPDLVIEVLSPSTSSRDAIVKRRRYEGAGVREYWMVHPADRIVTVFRLGADGTFAKPDYFGDDAIIEVSFLPGLAIDLSLLFPPLPQILREPPAIYPPERETRTR